MRREGTATALLCAALVLSGSAVMLPPRVAEARLDPMRIITSQIVQPNILLVLDTSGSMSERPETSDFPADVVGGDCYNGVNCVTAPMQETCSDGRACQKPYTCGDGVTRCNQCQSGAACQQARLCGSFPSKTGCRDSDPVCKNNTPCARRCARANTLCTSQIDCPATATCASRCVGSGAACTSDVTCGSGVCGSAIKRCSISNAICTGTAGTQGTCPNGQVCRNTCLTNTNTVCTSNAQCTCDTTIHKCTDDNSNCVDDSGCRDFCEDLPSCDPATTGSALCSYWCADGTQCGPPENYCNNANGTKNVCDRCADATTCFTTTHCGTDPVCPAGDSYVYKGSSRLAVAKHAMIDLVSQTQAIVNYGLMAFDQDGYFPYQSSTGGTTSTQNAYLSKGQLDSNNGRNANGTPKPTVTIAGTLYTFNAAGGAGNSLYGRQGGQTAQHDYCFDNCSFGGQNWSYQGSYYTYQQTTPLVTTVTTLASYQGQNSTTPPGMSYFNFQWDYASPDTCNVNSQCPSNSCNTGWNRCACGSGTQCKSGVCSGGLCASPGCGTKASPVCGVTSNTASCDQASNNDGNLRSGVELSDVQATRTTSLQALQAWLQPQTQGGLVAKSATPTGCVLQYNLTGSAPIGNNNDAYSYMRNLKITDALDSCRPNYVILVTDGEPNGPGDRTLAQFNDPNGCDTPACADPNSGLGTCNCRAVKAARNLAQLGVKTYAIGFGPDTAGSQTMENIARAGGTCKGSRCAFSATNEQELVAALRAAVFDALSGDYATSSPTVATTTQTGTTYAGNIGLIASADFPSWNGHLRAVDLLNTVAGVPPVLWDAGSQLANRVWSSRKVYTSDPSNNALIPFMSTGTTTNSASLFAAGLGASATEADGIARFALGQSRPWKLGPIFNSTAVTISKTVDVNIASHSGFVAAQGNRPRMAYVGADDMMVHAFYLESGAWGSAGDEAWAYVPPELFPKLTQLYVNGGQPGDPGSHVFGVASSPKLNDVCSNGCTATVDWKTVLVGGTGLGGSSYWALNITADPSSTTPITVLWRTGNSGLVNPKIGESWAVPAFGFVNQGGVVKATVTFASGYDDTSDGIAQGTYLNVLDAVTGAPLITPPQFVSPGGALLTEYSVIADAVNAVSGAAGNLTVATYQADLAGRIWRLGQGITPAGSPIYNAGIGHPFYYSPAAFLQQDGTVVMAANDGTFDDADVNPAAVAYTPQLTFLLDVDGTTTNLKTATVPLTSVCRSGCHLGVCDVNCPKFNSSARPIASPVILKNTDSTATGSVQVIFSIYQPGANKCDLGKTSVVVYDVVVTSGSITGRASEAKEVAGEGKAAGIMVGAGGELLSGSSGHRKADGTVAQSAITVVAGQKNALVISTTPATGGTRVMGVTETGN